LYEENIGPLTPLIADALKDAEELYYADWIVDAISLAVKNNKRNWKYCEAILKRWKEEGRAESKIDATIKNLARGASTEKSRQLRKRSRNDLLGDPNCPHCGGIGYLRVDVPVGHFDFGKLEICVCRRANITDAVRERLFALSHLDELKDLTFESFKPRGRKGLGEMQSTCWRWLITTHIITLKPERLAVTARRIWRGKTHLAAAIANFAVGMGVPTLFLTVQICWMLYALPTAQKIQLLKNASIKFATQNF